jgi:hypothetical protein
MQTMTIKQVAAAAGVHPQAVAALSGLIGRYTVGSKRYAPSVVPIVALADELAAAVGEGQMAQETAARILARTTAA